MGATDPNRKRSRVEPGIRKVTAESGISYEARIRSPDGREHVRTFKKLADARQFRNTMQGAKARGQWKDPRLDRVTFAQWISGPRWTQHTAKQRISTQRIYAAAIAKALPSLGPIPIQKIRRIDIVDLRNTLSAGTLGSGSVAQVIRVVKTALQLAVEAELLEYNVAQRVKVESDKIAAEQDNRRALTPDEAGRLIQFAPDRYRALFVLALTTGLRWAELAGLRRSSIDLEAGTLQVSEQARYEPGQGLVIGPPKTRSGTREVPIPDEALELLSGHLDRFTAVAADSFVFTMPRGGALEHSAFRERYWLPTLKEAKVRPVVFHALRATTTTWLYEAGADPKTVARILGHGSVDIGANVYARGTTKAKRAASERIGAVFTEAIESTTKVVPIRKPA